MVSTINNGFPLPPVRVQYTTPGNQCRLDAWSVRTLHPTTTARSRIESGADVVWFSLFMLYTMPFSHSRYRFAGYSVTPVSLVLAQLVLYSCLHPGRTQTQS